MTDDCIATIKDGVGIIELARPNKFNCISPDMLGVILGAVQRFAVDPNVQVVLVRGQGRNFCVGADLNEVKALRDSPGNLRQFLELGSHTLDFIETLPKPVIAAVQGFCLAGGFELSLACDIVVAARGAKFGDQHAEFGLYPGWGGARRMVRLLGPRRSFDLMATAQRVDACTAGDWGLVTKVVDDEALADESWQFCQLLKTRSAAGLLEMKKAVLRTIYEGCQSDDSYDIEAGIRTITGADAAEGVAAFEQRRPPVFLSRIGERKND